MDDAHRIVFDCVPLVSILWNHLSLFPNEPGSWFLDVFLVQNPAEVAAFVLCQITKRHAKSSLSD